MAIIHKIQTKEGLQAVKLTPVRAIRMKCQECSNFSPGEIKKCQITDCALFPYRFGKRPEQDAEQQAA